MIVRKWALFSPAPDGGQGGNIVIDTEESPFEDDFEIQEETNEQAGPSKEDLLKEFEALKAQNAELKTKADSSQALKSSFEEFGTRLEKAQSRAPMAPAMQQQPGESIEEFKKRINQKYLEDPYETMVEFSNRYVGSAMQTVVEQSLALQREIAVLKSPDKDFISKYRDEIDAEVSRYPTEMRLKDPEVYDRSIALVKARHMDEIIAQKVAEAIAQKGGAAPAAPAPRGQAEAPALGSPPASGPRVISLSPAKKARIEARQRAEGVPHIPLKEYIQMLIDDGEYDKA